MNYSFDIDIATEYGIDNAIFINNLAYWVKLNKANNTNLHDGKYWTYNSVKALCELFPFWSVGQIKRVIKNCIDLGAIETNNFNKIKYDRTTWYTLSDKLSAICSNKQMENLKSAKGKSETSQPIPNINTDINTDKESTKEEDKSTHTEIIKYLNLKTKKNYKTNSRDNIKHINARLNNGFVLKDFKQVIDIKTDEWIGDAKMFGFLRPSTLFGTKFEEYLNQISSNSFEDNRMFSN
jgi:uncharacterized phage protein (TIGR02220 family)